MLNPVSLNVIRQAIVWHGLPKPTAIFCGGRSVNEHGTIALNYFLHFDPAQLVNVNGLWALTDGKDLPAVTELIKDCFCDDIQTIDTHYSLDVNRVVTHIMALPFVAEVF